MINVCVMVINTLIYIPPLIRFNWLYLMLLWWVIVLLQKFIKKIKKVIKKHKKKEEGVIQSPSSSI